MTNSNSMFQFGDLILVSFPFTDGTGIKKRPAMVLLNLNDGDVIIARVTTQSMPSEFEISISDWVGAGLLAPSFLKLHKLMTLHVPLINRTLGKLNPVDLKKAKSTLELLFSKMQG